MIRRLRHKPLAIISLTWIAVLVLVSVLAPWIAPDRPDQQDIASAFQGPSSAHWLGTGQLGLDVLSRLVYGGRVSLASTAVSVIAYALVGIPFGLLAGYRSGWVDRIILRVSDIAYAIPGAVIVLVVLAIRPNDETAAMIALGLLAAPSLARVVRSATIAVREELYIRSARVAGLRDLLILRKHVLPSVLSTVIVQVALFSTAAIGLETGLGFLGVGTTQVSWGQLIAEASANLSVQPWLLVPSGLLVVSFILALGLLGDGLRDAAAEAHAGPPPLPRGQGSPPARPAVTSAADETLPTHAPILQIADLAVQFAGRSGGTRQVLGGIHLSVARGEKVGIVGESGSGKSVTVAAILGLLPGTGRTTQGTITFDEVALAATDTAALARLRGRRISMISQNPVSGLDPAYTVRFQLAEAVRAATDLRGDDVDRRVVELLRSVQLPDPERVAASYPHQLSGGMAQRVGIAAALAGSPDLILADEPTTALDVTVQAEILEVLRGLDAAVILVTHDWGVLAQLCTRALVMYAGQIVEEGAVDTLLSAARHPYTEGLLRSNPAGAERGSVLPAIPGTVPPVELWPVGCRFADRCPLVQDACRAEPVRLVRTDGGRSLSRCRRHELVGAAGTQVWQAEHAPALRPAGGRTERPIVQVRNLTVTYRQGRSALTAVDRVDLSVAPGRTLGLVGESGSGKSTIGAAILGLVPPAAGEVLLDGEPVDRASRAERQAFSTRVQAVFQDPFGSMNPTRPVGASITEALRYTIRLDSDEIARRTSGVLHEVGLADDILQRYPSQLSGGQLQRLAIARALVVDPDFVVCDEAVSALDLSVQAQVVNLFQRLAAARGLSYLFISHDLSVVAHISDDIAVLFAGQVMEYGPATTVATQPAHPYTRNLVQAVPTPARTPTAGRSMPTGGRPAVSPTTDPRSLTGCPYAQRCPAATQVCRTDRPELLSRGMGVRVACHHHDELMTSDEEVVGSHVP